MSGISSQQKEGSSKKRRKRKKEQGLKNKRGETSYKEAPCFKRKKEKKRMKFTSCWEKFYRKQERKELTFFYSTKFGVWPHPHPHIICICTTFYSMTFPLSLYHSPLTMIICHTNSLEFSFTFTIYKV
jgi:hypothetical protein